MINSPYSILCFKYKKTSKRNKNALLQKKKNNVVEMKERKERKNKQQGDFS